MDESNNRVGGRVSTRLLIYLAKRWRLFIISIASIIILTTLNSLVPIYIRDAIDQGILMKNLWNTIYYTIIILGLVGGAGVASYTSRYFITLLSQQVVHDIRVDAFKSIQRQSMDFFDKTYTGQLISRITNDANRLARFFSNRLRNLVNSILLASLSIYYMYTMSPRLSIIAAAMIITLAIVNTRYVMIIRPIYDAIRHQIGVLASIVTNNLNGIKTVKALSLEEHETSIFNKENNEFTRMSLKAAKIRAIYGNISTLVLGASISLILYYGAYAAINGELTIGEITAFITYLTMLMWPMRALGLILGGFQRTLASAKRIFEIIDAKPKIYENPSARKLRDIRGEILLKNIVFSYIDEHKVLNNINLRIKPGEKILITGPPGSGKSTILKLLMRLYDPQSGNIYIDGIDIKDIKLDSLRKFIAMVPQEPFIFSGTIRENISFGADNIQEKDIIEAAKAAQIHEFIMSLPKRYDTLVGEKGITLSGGQRQRIAIARALLTKPKILLLDDPVSNLDAETERKLIQDLEKIFEDRTVIIVSQRLSLARLADRIIVLDKGRIVEEGTHNQLITKKGLYHKLYTTSLTQRKILKR